MFYTSNGSYPSSLPAEITLTNGFIRTDRASFTEAEIADAGYISAPAKPGYNTGTERLDWDGESWQVVPIPLPPLSSISPRQLLIGLLSIGIDEGMVLAELEEISDPHERAIALIEWNKAGMVERDHPLVDEIAAALALPAGQVDDLWRWAAGL